MLARRVSGQDLEIIRNWYQEHGQAVPEVHSIPDVGIIVEGIAAGFLYQTDSSVCLIDGYISNPSSLSQIRSEAIELITASLMDQAVRRGFKQIIALTSAPTIKARALEWGFEDDGQYSLLINRIK